MELPDQLNHETLSRLRDRHHRMSNTHVQIYL